MLIAGNWKMYKGPEETAVFCRALRDQLEWVDGVDVAVCPPFVSLSAAVQALAGTDIAVAAQSVHWDAGGRVHRGDLRADAVRARRLRRDRRPFRAPPAVRRDGRGGSPPGAHAALDAGLSVIACVGETEAEREVGRDRGRPPPGQVSPLEAARPARPRLRAGLGDRHRQDRHPRPGTGGARLPPQPDRRADPLRRVGQARQRGRAPRPARRRRRPRRRRLPRRRSRFSRAICKAAAPSS